MCESFPVKLSADGRTKWRCAKCGTDYETKVDAERTTCRGGMPRDGLPTEERVEFLRGKIPQLERKLEYLERASPNKSEGEGTRSAINDLSDELTRLEGRATEDSSHPQTPERTVSGDSTQDVECDRAIFMPAQVNDKTGYQIVASSDGVRQNEAAFIGQYGVPFATPVKRQDFTEARRLIRLPSGRYCYNYIYNMEVGYDGRTGAIYSEFLIVDDETSLLENGANPWSFEVTFRQDQDSIAQLIADVRTGQKKLPKTSIHLGDDGTDNLDYDTIIQEVGDKETLALILENIIHNDRQMVLAVPSNEPRTSFLYNLLLLLPARMRTISCTTFSAAPEREPFLRCVITPTALLKRQGRQTEYLAIQLPSPSPPHKPTKQDSASYFLAATVFGAASGESTTDEIRKLHSVFEENASEMGSATTEGTSVDLGKVLEYSYKEQKFVECSNDNEKLEIALELARPDVSLSRAKSIKYYDEAKSIVLTVNDGGKVSACFTEYLRLLSGMEVSQFTAVYSQGLDKLLSLDSPQVVRDFIATAMEMVQSSEKFDKDSLAVTTWDQWLASTAPGRQGSLMQFFLGNPKLRGPFRDYVWSHSTSGELKARFGWVEAQSPGPRPEYAKDQTENILDAELDSPDPSDKLDIVMFWADRFTTDLKGPRRRVLGLLVAGLGGIVVLSYLYLGYGLVPLGDNSLQAESDTTIFVATVVLFFLFYFQRGGGHPIKSAERNLMDKLSTYLKKTEKETSDEAKKREASDLLKKIERTRRR